VELLITVRLYKDRYRLGQLVQGGVNVCPCLGIADNSQAIAHGNPARNPLLPYGDTPTGVYTGTVIPPGDVDGYGEYRRIFLTPISGDGVLAEKPPGNRAGLLIHGGKLNPLYTWWDGLRPTYGCVRVPDTGMKAIMDVVDQNPAATIQVGVIEMN
jgi:hypothetical protein